MTRGLRLVLETSAVLGLLLGLLALTQFCLVMPWGVLGPSMQPTIEPGDRLLVDRWTLEHRLPRVGEVVLLLGPGGTPMFKRVAQAPGDVSAGVWIVGDNPAASSDSRHFGAVSRERILGRVTWRYWPISRLGPVR